MCLDGEFVDYTSKMLEELSSWFVMHVSVLPHAVLVVVGVGIQNEALCCGELCNVGNPEVRVVHKNRFESSCPFHTCLQMFHLY